MCGYAVDYAQFCYAGYWHLFRNDLELRTHGRYYWNDNAPVYPGPHVYWNAAFADRNHPHDLVLGPDLEGDWHSIKGQWPIAFPAPLVLGTDRCFADGETALPYDASTAIEGLPEACFPPIPVGSIDWSVFNPNYRSDPFASGAQIIQLMNTPVPGPGDLAADDPARWWYLSNYQHTGTQKFWAKMIQLVYYDQKDLLDRITDLTWQGTAEKRFDTHTLFLPGSYIINGNDGVYIVLDGTNKDMLPELLFQFLEGQLPMPAIAGVKVNQLYLGAANKVFARRFQMGPPRRPRVFLTGHSMGGAVAMVMALMIKIANPDFDVRWLTFAQPKAGNQGLITGLRSTQGLAIFNHNDVVPQIPPGSTDAIVWSGLSLPLAVAIWNDYKRAEFPFVMNQFGHRIEPQNFDFGSRVVGDQTLGVVIGQVIEYGFLGGPVPLTGPHNITEYLRRLQLRGPNQYPDTDEVERLYHLLQIEGQAQSEVVGKYGPPVVTACCPAGISPVLTIQFALFPTSLDPEFPPVASRDVILFWDGTRWVGDWNFAGNAYELRFSCQGHLWEMSLYINGVHYLPQDWIFGTGCVFPIENHSDWVDGIHRYGEITTVFAGLVLRGPGNGGQKQGDVPLPFDGQVQTDQNLLHNDGQALGDKPLPADGQAMADKPLPADGQAEGDLGQLGADGQAEGELGQLGADGQAEGELGFSPDGQAEGELGFAADGQAEGDDNAFVTFNVLMEDGSDVLMEDGTNILME